MLLLLLLLLARSLYGISKTLVSIGISLGWILGRVLSGTSVIIGSTLLGPGLGHFHRVIERMVDTLMTLIEWLSMAVIILISSSLAGIERSIVVVSLC